jgi:hypothetical protein
MLIPQQFLQFFRQAFSTSSEGYMLNSTVYEASNSSRFKSVYKPPLKIINNICYQTLELHDNNIF